MTKLRRRAHGTCYIGDPRPFAITPSELYRTRSQKNCNDQYDPHTSRSTGKPECLYFSRGLSLVQKHRDAVVDGEGLKRLNLVSIQGVFRPGAISGFAYRYYLRVSGDAGVPRMGYGTLQTESRGEDQRRSACSRCRLRDARSGDGDARVEKHGAAT